MNDSLPLNTFARNPRRALRHLPEEGLLLTRPGEPDLRLTLDANAAEAAEPDKAVSVGSDPEDLAGPAFLTPKDAPAELSGPTVAGDAPRDEKVAAERSPAAMIDLARAALLRLHRGEFDNLLLDHRPWIRSLPHAVRREVLDDAERARKLEGETGLSATLARWEERTSVFRR